MSSIVSASNTIDWLSGAWSSIQGSSGSGNAIVDAAASNGTISFGLSDSNYNALSSTLTSVAQNLVQQQNILVAQKAVARVQNEAAAKLNAISSQASSTTGRVLNIKA
jgi:hypothetical protein